MKRFLWLVLLILVVGAGILSTIVFLRKVEHSMTQQATLAGWLFPGNPACSAMQEIADGRHIDVLKPEFFHVNDDGTLTERTTVNAGCNGYSPANVALLKQYSTQQFVTVSGGQAGMIALTASASLTTQFINTLVSFLQANQLTGIEIDFEEFGQWSSVQYNGYKNLVMKVGQSLHAANFQLMLDGPCILNTQYQAYYQWKWEDFTPLPVDYLVAMAYDLELDRGIGIDVSKLPPELTLTPVSTLQDITNCCTWMLSKVKDPNRIVIGLNSYGYTGKVGTYTATNQTYQQIAQQPGFLTMPKRDMSSGELWWMANNIVYDYSDVQTLNGKVQAVLKAGLSQVSLWHLGGNQWPTVVVQLDPLLTAFAQKYPGFDQWYAQHFDAQGNYHV